MTNKEGNMECDCGHKASEHWRDYLRIMDCDRCGCREFSKKLPKVPEGIINEKSRNG